MKKIIVLLLMFSLCLPVGMNKAEAAQPITIHLNKGVVFFATDAFVEKGTTLFPLRNMFELLDATVNWNSKTQTIEAFKDKRKIWLKIGSKNAKVNGKTVTLAVAPKMKNGRTYVPLRFVSEALGEPVEWEKSTNSIYIGFKNAPIAEPTSALPQGAYLKESTRDYKAYGYTKKLPSGGKIEEVSVSIFQDNTLKFTVIAYDKDGNIGGGRFNATTSTWSFTTMGPQPEFSSADLQVLKDVLNLFRKSFE